MATYAVCAAVAATLVTIFLNRVTAYYNRATTRHLAGLPAEPKPWFVRVYDRIF